jgi:hypothetical protein
MVAKQIYAVCPPVGPNALGVPGAFVDMPKFDLIWPKPPDELA